MAMFCSMASLAKCLAISRVVFPRQAPTNVSLMMNLEHNVIDCCRAQASGTAATVQLDNVLAKFEPIGV